MRQPGESQVTHCQNPFRPGAGHMPPYLAGRETEKREFEALLNQDVILKNLIITGLRGVGKTVLLDTLKPIAIGSEWLWVGSDMSEATSVSEHNLAIRLITDLAVVTSKIAIGQPRPGTGFNFETTSGPPTLDSQALSGIFDETPGLASDRLKAVLEEVWFCVEAIGKRGLVFAYDEAQNLADHRSADEYPLSLLLEVLQSVQKKGMRFVLVLTGLPTLSANLVAARTYAERMFRNLVLERLSRIETEEAILKAVDSKSCPVDFSQGLIDTVFQFTLGYPYFVQYVCREAFDLWTQDLDAGEELRDIPMFEITMKLDSDFFAGRWDRATDRQRDLLGVVAQMETAASEFTVREIVEKSREVLGKPFNSSHVNQMLGSLCDVGLVYKVRWGKYCLAVPLLDAFIRRQLERR
ncbi:MAG: ATP-binding protein [Thermoleophilia bacterium]